MKRRPIFYFKDMQEPGIVYVPVGGFVVIGDDGAGLVKKILILALDKTLPVTTTLQKFMLDASLWKEVDSTAADDLIHKQLAFKIDSLEKTTTVNTNSIAANTKNIGANKAEIINNHDVILRHSVKITNNKKDIDDILADNSVAHALIKHEKEAKKSFATITKNHNQLLLDINAFSHSPVFGDASTETHIYLMPSAGQESSLISKNILDPVTGKMETNWRVGVFHNQPNAGNVGAGVYPEALKVESIDENIVLAVPPTKSVMMRIGGVYKDIQAISAGTTQERPAHPSDGEMYFDKNIKKPIWYHDGEAKWYYADGTEAI